MGGRVRVEWEGVVKVVEENGYGEVMWGEGVNEGGGGVMVGCGGGNEVDVIGGN